TGVHNITITQNVLEQSGAGVLILGNNASNGASTMSYAGSVDDNIRITDNTIKEMGYHGIITQGYVNNVLIENNIVQHWALTDAAAGGLTCGRLSSGCRVDNNTLIQDHVGVTSTGSHAISFDLCLNSEGTGNVISGSSGDGIEDGVC